MFLKRFFNAVYRFLISLKLAILTFVLLAVLTAIGTFVESKYDQEIANTLVYTSFWMSFVMIILALEPYKWNLMAGEPPFSTGLRV